MVKDEDGVSALENCCACFDAKEFENFGFYTKCSAKEPCDYGYCDYEYYVGESVCVPCPPSGATCLDGHGWGTASEKKMMAYMDCKSMCECEEDKVIELHHTALSFT